VVAWPITYIDHDNQEVTVEHFLASFLVKGRMYEDEQELRFLLHLNEVVEKGVHVAVDLDSLIQGVPVRTDGDKAILKEVENLVAATGINCPVESGF
jgi:hypothetical protein